MREDIEFAAEDGLTLRGWLYRPDGASEPLHSPRRARCNGTWFLEHL